MHFATFKTAQDWRDISPLEGWGKVVKIYDGDTIWIVADISNPLSLTNANPILRKINIRLARIDTPELKGVTADVKAKAIAARDHVRDLILDNIVYFKLGNYGIEGESMDTFKRQIGEIYFKPSEVYAHQLGEVDTQGSKVTTQQIIGGQTFVNLSDHLLQGGYAIPFKRKK